MKTPEEQVGEATRLRSLLAAQRAVEGMTPDSTEAEMRRALWRLMVGSHSRPIGKKVAGQGQDMLDYRP